MYVPCDEGYEYNRLAAVLRNRPQPQSTFVVLALEVSLEELFHGNIREIAWTRIRKHQEVADKQQRPSSIPKAPETNTNESRLSTLTKETNNQHNVKRSSIEAKNGNQAEAETRNDLNPPKKTEENIPPASSAKESVDEKRQAKPSLPFSSLPKIPEEGTNGNPKPPSGTAKVADDQKNLHRSSLPTTDANQSDRKPGNDLVPGRELEKPDQPVNTPTKKSVYERKQTKQSFPPSLLPNVAKANTEENGKRISTSARNSNDQNDINGLLISEKEVKNPDAETKNDFTPDNKIQQPFTSTLNSTDATDQRERSGVSPALPRNSAERRPDSLSLFSPFVKKLKDQDYRTSVPIVEVSDPKTDTDIVNPLQRSSTSEKTSINENDQSKQRDSSSKKNSDASNNESQRSSTSPKNSLNLNEQTKQSISSSCKESDGKKEGDGTPPDSASTKTSLAEKDQTAQRTSSSKKKSDVNEDESRKRSSAFTKIEEMEETVIRDVFVQPGMPDGTRIKYPQGPNETSEIFFVQLVQLPNERFTREGHDLRMRIQVSFMLFVIQSGIV